MILKFIYENFKSFEKAELSLQQLTTLIGANASGKSNAIEGIRILSMLVSGLELGVILDGTQNTEPQIRGGSSGCKRFRTGAFRLGCRMASPDKDKDLLYEIKIGVNGRIMIEEEGLYLLDHDEPDTKANKIFKTKPAAKESSDIKVEYKNGKKGTNPGLICIRSASVLPQMVSKVPRDTQEEMMVAEYMEHAVATLKRIIVLDPDPMMMRGYCRIADIELRKNCDNISAVLFEICKNQDKKNRLLSFIRRLPENEIEDISFIKTKLGDVIFALKERYYNSTELVDAKKLSDGTLRCMAIISALLSAPEDSLVIVEEVDNGIHPARLNELVTVMYEMIQMNSSDLVVTTHNAGMINQYKRDELAGVNILYRENDKGTSKFISASDLDMLTEFVMSGGLGKAMTDNRLLRSIKEGRDKKDLSWLEVSE